MNISDNHESWTLFGADAAEGFVAVDTGHDHVDQGTDGRLAERTEDGDGFALGGQRGGVSRDLRLT